MTADGKRQKTGGGILWGLIKEKEPNAYREIMKNAKEFEVCIYSLALSYFTELIRTGKGSFFRLSLLFGAKENKLFVIKKD